jgi:hypothetical protein
MVAPALQSEGKTLQRDQGIGMGATSAAAPAPNPTGAHAGANGHTVPAEVAANN